MWGDTPEGQLDDEVNNWKNIDIFHLRQLFGEEPYKIFEEEEWWDLCKHHFYIN